MTETPAKLKLDGYRKHMLISAQLHDLSEKLRAIQFEEETDNEEVATPPQEDYTLKRNPIKRGIEGVGLLLVVIGTFALVAITWIIAYLVTIPVLILRLLINGSRQLIPVALLIVLIILAYKLLNL